MTNDFDLVSYLCVEVLFRRAVVISRIGGGSRENDDQDEECFGDVNAAAFCAVVFIDNVFHSFLVSYHYHVMNNQFLCLMIVLQRLRLFQELMK